MKYSLTHPYAISEAYSRRVAYFCMEYAIHQPLKIYAGGLGFLSGSFLRSAFELRQNVIGIGILWKFGYYDQVRKSDQGMDVLFQEKVYGFLQRTEIKFSIKIAGHEVFVTAYYLPPEIFSTAPLFLLSTDLPENDYLAKTICHKLYDSNPETKTAAAILLGVGGAKLLEELDWEPETYHLNESHALPLAFYLYSRYKNIDEVKKRLVYTNHTPEEAGNPKTDLFFLERMGFLCGIPITEVKAIMETTNDLLDHTQAALKFSGRANAVSRIHKQTLAGILKRNETTSRLQYITNGQNFSYWANHDMYDATESADDARLQIAKSKCKEELFEIVADQNGEIFDKNVLTIVFAKRFAGYKRADLLLRNMERFERIINNKERPVQIIWAGKPYPMDYTGIGTFDKIVNVCKSFINCSILVGYELKLSKLLKQGADVWLNVPRLTHEACGTSGMSAAMNGAINLSIPDGWFAEFAVDKKNCFVIPSADPTLPDHLKDDEDAKRLYDLLEHEVIPMYYDFPSSWVSMIKQSMTDVKYAFGSNRMAIEYYKTLYTDYIEPIEKNSIPFPLEMISQSPLL